MNLFSVSRSFGKGTRLLLLLAVLFLSLGPGGAGVAYAAPPVHDDFDSAKVITTLEYHDTNVNTLDATPSDNTPNTDDPDGFSCEGETFHYGFASVWYQYTPSSMQGVALDTLGSNYDTFIAVWTGTRGNLNLVQNSCNDDTVANQQSETSFVANPGTTYYIEVAQFNDGLGSTHIIGGNLVFNAYPADVNVTIGNDLKGRYYLPPNVSLRKRYSNVNDGPVEIRNMANDQIIAAERVIYTIQGKATSYSEMMGLPHNQLDDTYWFPWYNSIDLDTQLRIGNVSNSAAHVNVYIAGALRTPAPITLAVGESTRLSFARVNSGPVQITSTQPIVAAERVIYKIQGIQTSFSEMMGLPAAQLNTTYWFPWYNNKDLDTQIRIGNVSNSQANVSIYIAGVLRTPSPITLGVGESTRQSFLAVNQGPVQIVSNVPVVAAQRVIYKVQGIQTSFSEMMGLPDSLLDARYWMPWYNNVSLDTQLRFGLP